MGMRYQPTNWRTVLLQVGRYRSDATTALETRIGARDLQRIRSGQLPAPRAQKQRERLLRLWRELYGEVSDAG